MAFLRDAVPALADDRLRRGALRVQRVRPPRPNPKCGKPNPCPRPRPRGTEPETKSSVSRLCYSAPVAGLREGRRRGGDGAAQDLIEIRRAVRRDKRPLRSADEAALDGFYVIQTNVPEKRMSAAAVVETCKRLGRVERAFRTMKASDLQVRPIRHRREPRVRAHLLICMLAYYVEKHMREALAPMLFDDEHGPVRDSPVAKAERLPQARRKAASKRTSPGEDVHDFRGLLAQLGTPAMNRIEPSGPGKPGFDVPASPTPIQAQALKLLNAEIPMR